MLEESKLQRGELKSISKILLKMQEHKNGGRGVQLVRDIALNVKKGRISEAIVIARNESDKLCQYPDLRRFIHDVIYPIGYVDENTGKLVND